jgi:NitT/TauT family transport system ATP-binding protein
MAAVAAVEASPMPQEAAIAIDRVSHGFVRGSGDTVQTLNEVSLEVRRGEMLCLIGPSGCGKSTLLNIIGGLLAPSTGQVRVNGAPITGPSPGQISFVFQENTLFPWNTILDNIKVALEFQGVPHADRQGRAEEALEAVGLSDFRNHYPHQLSGGMKQRASLARALSQ